MIPTGDPFMGFLYICLAALIGAGFTGLFYLARHVYREVSRLVELHVRGWR